MKAEKAVGLPLTLPLVISHQVSQIPGLSTITCRTGEVEISSHTLPAKVTKIYP